MRGFGSAKERRRREEAAGQTAECCSSLYSADPRATSPDHTLERGFQTTGVSPHRFRKSM